MKQPSLVHLPALQPSLVHLPALQPSLVHLPALQPSLVHLPALQPAALLVACRHRTAPYDSAPAAAHSARSVPNMRAPWVKQQLQQQQHP